MYAERLRSTLPALRDRIAAVCARAGRDPAEVTLVAVTKTHPLEAIDAAVEAGLTDLGENRVSELLQKAAARPGGVRWHMIGHLQRRKAPELIGVADLIQSVDTVRLGERLSRKAQELGVEVGILAQVNTSGEASKGGFGSEREGPFDAPATLSEILALSELPGLRLEGLMTMAPFVHDEAVLRPSFSRLRELSEHLRCADPSIGTTLSMGMTNDLDLAIEEGSTMLRIGTALFGPRPT